MTLRKREKNCQLNCDLPLILISEEMLKCREWEKGVFLESVEYGNTKSLIGHLAILPELQTISICSVLLLMASKQAVYAQNHHRLLRDSVLCS